jgi:ABC-2 type transport system permease protein
MKLHRIQALLMKYIYISINRWDRLLEVIYWPILDIFIWGFMSIYIRKISDVNILSMILGGIILWVIVWRGANDIGIFILEDYWSKSLYNIFSSPLKLPELIIAIISFGLIRALFTFSVLALLVLALYGLNIFSLGFVVLPVFIVSLLIFAWALGIFLSGFILRWGGRVQVLAWSVVFLIQPFSCVFYPLSALPGWAQKVALTFPSTHVFEGMRAAMAGNPLPMKEMFFGVVVSIIFFMLCTFFFYSNYWEARKKGTLAKAE